MSEDEPRLSPRLLERVAVGAAGEDPGARVVEHRAGRDRAVLEHRFEGGVRLFAKRYGCREDARRAHEILRSLEEQGFGAGSRYRVPEPLGCVADGKVLVVRAAPGECLATLMAHPGRREEGLHAAAGWLAHLHSLPVGSAGAGEDRLEGAFRIARLAARASARHPSAAGVLAELVDELGSRAAKSAESGALARTHGRYHLDHVFVAEGTVTVIDLDRSAVADPAKDLGEFLHRLRMFARRAHLDEVTAGQAALAFFETYAERAQVAPAALSYFWSHSIVFTLLRALEKDHPKWRKRLAFYRAEFDAVPRRADSLLSLTAAGAVA